jgi:c-di-AMP phosphodiesterase-like protein
MWMKMLRMFLKVNIIILLVISIISFWTNNVADAIYFMVVANFLLLAMWIETRREGA